MGSLRMFLQNIRLRMKLDRVRQLGRQYPVFCFLLLVLLLSTVLLNRWAVLPTIPLFVCFFPRIPCLFSAFHRYLHIIMVFWSFLAGVVTFYCSLGPESLLPNMLVSIRPKSKVRKQTWQQTWQQAGQRAAEASEPSDPLLIWV